MKKVLLYLVFSLPLLFYANGQYVTNGNAVSSGGSCYLLTEAVNTQGGSVWFQNKISLAADFTVEAQVFLGNSNSPGADGLAFVLQPICSGLGGIGGGIGYFGINPSLAVELDTYQNVDRSDPAEDHIGLMANGVVDHGAGGASVLQGYNTLANLEDGNNHILKIVWTAGTMNLKVYLDNVLQIDYTGDIVTSIFGGNKNVFWGFTAATGSENNEHEVCILSSSFTVDGSFTVTKPTCPDFDNGAIELNPAGGVGPFTYLWSNNATTKDISGITAGTYGVTVTDNNGCETIYSIDVVDAIDETDPEITCPDNISVSNGAGLCGAFLTITEATATDNCSVSSITGARSDGNELIDIFPVGTTTIKWTATDENGNNDECIQTIIVTDDEAPVARCKPVTVTLVGGVASITADDVNDGSSDNCGIQSVTVSSTNFTCDDIGDNTVTLTVTDIYGKTATCTAVVTVVGEIPTCSIASIPSNNTYTGGVSTNLYIGYGPQSTTLQVSAPASGAPYTYAWSGSTLSNYNTANPVFTASAEGTFTFTVEVTNKYGCKTTCSITICVMDIRVPGSNGKKVYVCHVPPGNPANAHTLSISVNAVPAHVGLHGGDRLGDCDKVICTPDEETETLISQKAIIAIDDPVKELTVTVSPNPTSDRFVFRLQSNETAPVTIRIVNGLGQAVETANKLNANSTIYMGGGLRGGMYFAEVLQGDKRKIVKLLKQ